MRPIDVNRMIPRIRGEYTRDALYAAIAANEDRKKREREKRDARKRDNHRNS